MLRDPEKEKATCDVIEKRYGAYKRLGTFFYKQDVNTLLKIKKERERESRNK